MATKKTEETTETVDLSEIFSKLEALTASYDKHLEYIEENETIREALSTLKLFEEEIKAEKDSIYQTLLEAGLASSKYAGASGSYSFSGPSVRLELEPDAPIDLLQDITTSEGHPLVRPQIDFDALMQVVEEGILSKEFLLEEGVVVEKERKGCVRYYKKKAKK